MNKKGWVAICIVICSCWCCWSAQALGEKEVWNDREQWKDCKKCNTIDCLIFQEDTQRVCKKEENGDEYELVWNGSVDALVSVPPGSFVEEGKLDCICNVIGESGSITHSTVRAQRDTIINDPTVWSGNKTVIGKIIVANTTLTILAGTTLMFADSNSLIEVTGNITSQGTPDLPITFTNRPFNGSPKHGGVAVLKGTGVFEFCTFQYATTAIAGKQGAIITVSNSTFRFNKNALVAADAYISSSLFVNNSQDAISLVDFEIANISGCGIHNNGRGIVLSSVHQNTAGITDCNIANNDYGIYIYSGNFSTPFIQSCVIHQNQVGIYQSGSVTFGLFVVQNCNISTNGKGIHWDSSSPFRITENNFFGNQEAFSRTSHWDNNINTVFELSHNYFGTPNVAFDDLMANPNLPIINYSPYYSENRPCEDCMVYVPTPANYLAENTTWGPSNGPLNFTTDIRVMKGVIVTIMPGTTIKFAAGKTLFVEGTIKAEGEALNVITFTSINASFWGGIFYRSSIPLVLNHTIVERARYGTKMTGPTSLSVYNTIFRNNKQAINMALSPGVGNGSISLNRTQILSSSQFAIDTSASGSNMVNLTAYLSEFIDNYPSGFNMNPITKVTMSYNNILNSFSGTYRVFNGASYKSFSLKYNYFGQPKDDCFWSDTILAYYPPVDAKPYIPALDGVFQSVCFWPVASEPTPEFCEMSYYIAAYYAKRRDVCGVCDGYVTSCTKCSTQPNQPYACSNSFCQRNPMTCLNSSDLICEKGVCWDGSCVGDNVDYPCPIFTRCHVNLPKRCSNGVCVAKGAVCPSVNSSICPHTLCPDGSCASACFPYNGCPANQIMCPDGSCTFDYTKCNTSTTPPWFESIPVTVASTADTVFINANTTTSLSYIKMEFRGTEVRQATFGPVADSALRDLSSPWYNNAGFERNVVSMVLSTNLGNYTNVTLGPDADVSLTFYPVDLRPDTTYCLGNVTLRMWTCQSEAFNGSPNSSSITISTPFLSKYMAIIIDPSFIPPPTPAPTLAPPTAPTLAPTPPPTIAPTTPTIAPTTPTPTPNPITTAAPTSAPTMSPTKTPTTPPTIIPTPKPTATPTPSPKSTPSPTPTVKTSKSRAAILTFCNPVTVIVLLILVLVS